MLRIEVTHTFDVSVAEAFAYNTDIFAGHTAAYSGKVVGVAFAARALTHVLLFIGDGPFQGSCKTPAVSACPLHSAEYRASR